MKARTTRLVWADWIRVIATYLVIVIHMSAGILIGWQSESSFSWWTAHTYDSLARVAVPLFVLLSGCLLLGKVETIADFISKRVKRVVLPWIWWVTMTVVLDQLLFQELNVLEARPTHVLSRYFLTGFWFMPLLLQLYLVVPLLRVGLKKIPATVGFLVAFVLQLVVSTQSTSCLVQGTCQPWLLPLGLQYLGYFLLGFYLRGSSLSVARKWFVGVVWLLSVSTILYGTYMVSMYQGSFSEALYQYTSLPVMLAALCSFIGLKYLFKEVISTQSTTAVTLAKLSDACFGIFLVHAIIVKLLAATPLRVIFSTLSDWPLLGIPVVASGLFFASFLIIQGMKKIPLLRFFT